MWRAVTRARESQEEDKEQTLRKMMLCGLGKEVWWQSNDSVKKWERLLTAGNESPVLCVREGGESSHKTATKLRQGKFSSDETKKIQMALPEKGDIKKNLLGRGR